MKAIPNTNQMQVETLADIPAAPFYVVMRDKFFSGWGPAEVVAANAKARGDQSHVRINTTKPRPRPWWILQLMGPDDNRPWYTPGAFS
jgi:hypothetical protein